MTPALAKPLLTVNEYWDFCQRPENADRRTELIRGEVVEVPRPTQMHGQTILRLGRLLDEWLESTARPGYVSSDAGLVLEETPGTVVGPDVAYYPDAESQDDIPHKWSDVPPVLAVEVLSPNDKPTKVNARIQDFLRGGVKLVWLVDYEERRVTVYRAGRSHEVLGETAELTGGDELPGFSCAVAALFFHPRKPPAPPTPPSA